VHSRFSPFLHSLARLNTSGITTGYVEA
jgi:hypothetical protein